MKVLIEIPTWLGDAIMATPAIENLISHYKDIEITVFGSFISVQLFKHHPNVKHIIVDETKKQKNRYLAIYKMARELKGFDLALSFRSSFTSKVLMYLCGAKRKYNFKKTSKEQHQVLKYNDFVNTVLRQNLKANDLLIHTNPYNYTKPTLGINPGATYGSAKRWYPKEFAKAAVALSSKFDIVIFGGPGEVDIACDIENELKAANITNYENLSGKTSIPELIEKIAGLDLFITNDSGPMHVAAAFKVKTVAIFGPTRHKETHQWNNPNEIIIRKEMECAPCMKRECPLEHHNCMKEITSVDVLEAINA
jgi:heptosyltransferase-2